MDLFVREYGLLINASRDGQLAMRGILEAYLERIEGMPRDSLSDCTPSLVIAFRLWP